MLYRKATMADIPAIHALISEYASQGLMLRRTLLYLYESVRDFTVAVDPESEAVIGAAGLHILWHDLAEIRSLCVKAGVTKKGVGKGLVDFLIGESETMGLKRVFALTYQQGFFEKCAFTVVQKETLPQKVYSECIHCDKFYKCDEIAMIRLLVPPEELAVDDGFEIPLVAMPTWQKG